MTLTSVVESIKMTLGQRVVRLKPASAGLGEDLGSVSDGTVIVLCDDQAENPRPAISSRYRLHDRQEMTNREGLLAASLTAPGAIDRLVLCEAEALA
jgi:hypothetical protein